MKKVILFFLTFYLYGCSTHSHIEKNKTLYKHGVFFLELPSIWMDVPVEEQQIGMEKKLEKTQIPTLFKEACEYFKEFDPDKKTGVFFVENGEFKERYATIIRNRMTYYNEPFPDVEYFRLDQSCKK